MSWKRKQKQIYKMMQTAIARLPHHNLFNRGFDSKVVDVSIITQYVTHLQPFGRQGVLGILFSVA
jgi:hypothetical protein